MSHHARIEELSDSDPEEMDIDAFNLPSDSNSLIVPNAPPVSQPQSTSPNPYAQPSNGSPFHHPNPADAIPTTHSSSLPPAAKTYQCLYPIYFDVNRTRAEGRRVGKELAVPNPLAREIVDAVQSLGLRELNVIFEPGKTHPKDWANPGRVKIGIRELQEKRGSHAVPNKHHLYLKVAEYLRDHPTTEASPMRLRLANMPPVSKPLPPPAVPRGWKMGTVLPLHSPAVTGGGVSENLFKDMMKEMGGPGGPMGALANAAGGGGEVEKSVTKKKDKEKKKGRA